MTVAFKAIRPSSLSVIDGPATQAALRKNMKEYCDILIAELREDYNRVPEGPNYVRKYRSSGMRPIGVSFTGRKRRRDFKKGFGVGVGGGWHSSVSGDGQTGEVYNDVPYAKYVQGHIGQQAEHHAKAGWRTIDTVVRQTRPAFNKGMKDAIEVGIAKARQSRNPQGQFSGGFDE